MGTIGRSVEPGDGTGREPTAYWLTRALPRDTRGTLIAAGTVGGGLYLSGLVTAVATGRFEYLQASDFYLYALGAFFEVVLLCNWSSRYPELWRSLDEETRTGDRLFDVPRETYRDVVDRGLRRVYRLDGPVVLFVSYHVFVMLALFQGGPFGHIRHWNLVVVNLLGAFVVYLFVGHLLLLRDIAALPVTDVDAAAERFETVIDFGLLVIVEWFPAVTVLFAYVFETLYEAVAAGDRLWTSFLTILLGGGPPGATSELLLLLGFAVGGVLAFVVTLLLVHTSLAAARRRELHTIRREYDEFYELWKAESESTDRLATGLDILERKRTSVKAARTWPYNASMVLRLGVASQIPVLSLVARVLAGG
jgi:gas vesicle protein